MVLRAWVGGVFELVVSPLLLAELERALGYPKLSSRIDPDQAERVIEWLRSSATMLEDPGEPPPIRSKDPGDDYLLSLAAAHKAVLVSGDQHILDFEGLPCLSPRAFLNALP